MHIVIVTAAMAPGGAQRVISNLLKEWACLDIKCTLILTEKRNIFYKIPASVDIVEIGKKSNNKLMNKYRVFREIRRIIKTINPDVVLSLPEEIGVYVICFLLGTNIPIVVSERNNPWLMPNKRITRLIRKIVYPFASGYIFQTPQAASFFSKKIQKKGIVLNNPLDLSLLPLPFFGIREKVIATIGRLEKQKNIPLLLEAFSIFQKTHPDYLLKIYGDGSLRSELEKTAHLLLNADSYIFLGNNNKALEEIVSSKMFVMTSDYEGVPNALIEAMSCGIPSISTDFEPCGAAIIINDGINGYIVPCNDAVKLSEAMTMICDEKISLQFSKNSVDVCKKYDSSFVAGQWLEYLKERCSYVHRRG